MEIIRGYIFQTWAWFGHKVFGWHYIDVYAPNEVVVGITFSNDEKYIDKVGDI